MSAPKPRGEMSARNDRRARDPAAYLPLKPVWLQVMLAIAGGHRHGYAIRQEVEARTAGRMKLWPATLYGALGGLREAGLLEELDEAPDVSDDDERRRYYALTGFGRDVLRAEVERLEALVALARERQVAGGPGGG